MPRPSASRSFTLYGDMDTGWGSTPGGETIPGPSLTVDYGDSVTMYLYAEDGLPHRFHIDYDGDGQVDTGEPASAVFTDFTSFTFTASTAGTFTYRCTVHPTTMYGTWVTNPPPPTHDVAVTGVAPDKTSVTQGEPVIVTVVVQNQGTVSETTTVTAFAGTIAAGSSVVTIPAGNTQSVPIPWDTTGVAPGDYAIKGTASQVSGETDVADNEMTDGTVTVNAPPPPPPGSLAAELVGRSAWPAHHHFVVSRFGPTQTLAGKAANVGPGPVTALVRFTIRDSGGAIVAVVDSGSTVLPVDGNGIVTASWAVQLGKYSVTAQCWFDTNGDGTFDGSDPSTKAFSFSVVP
jgi:hypothetical protein